MPHGRPWATSPMPQALLMVGFWALVHIGPSAWCHPPCRLENSESSVRPQLQHASPWTLGVVRTVRPRTIRLVFLSRICKMGTVAARIP